MPVVAAHTRLVPGAASEYERLHRAIPDTLLDDLHDSGVTGWSIWRSGPDLFHVLDVRDRVAMREAMRRSDAHLEWQHRVAPLLAAPPAFGDLPLVWDLRTQRAI